MAQLVKSSFPCLLQGRSQHALEAPLFHPACYWIFIVDRHFFLAPSFRKFLTGPMKYTRSLPKRLFRFLGRCPSNGKKLRRQRKRTQRKRQDSQAAQQAPTRAHPDDKDRGMEAREQNTRETQAHTGSSPNSLQLLPHPRSLGRRPLYLGAHWRIVGTSGPTRVYVWTWPVSLMRWYFWTNEG